MFFKNIFTYFVLLVSLTAIFTFSSCKKSAEKKIIGKWELLKYDGSEPSVVYEFNDGEELLRYITKKITADSSITIIDTAYYAIETKNFRKNVRITKLDPYFGFDENGLWWIDNLNSSVMELQRVENPNLEGGPYLRYEFKKK